MSIVSKFIRNIERFFKYSTDSEPTTQQDFQEAMKNWVKTEEYLVDVTLWQPTTAYQVGNIVKTPSLASQYILECTAAGTSGAAEPDYSGADVGDVITDGTATWTVKQYATSDKYLPLTGGTITGNINGQHPFAKGTTPSAANNYRAFYFVGNNSNGYTEGCLGLLENKVTSGNVVSTYIRAVGNAVNSTTYCQISVNVDASGNVYTAAPTPEQTDSSTKIATTAHVKACVPKSIGGAQRPVYTNSNGVITACTATGSNGGLEGVQTFGTNYIRYASGLQICWASEVGVTSTSVTVTFPVAFTAMPICACSQTNNDHMVNIYDVSATNFRTHTASGSGGNVRWIAIGKWK